MVGQDFGFPVGMERKSPPEFRRRIVAAAISYRFGLRSIDSALKRYVDPNLYEGADVSLGDEISDYLRESASALRPGLRDLHTKDPTFGQLGSEITLFKVPNSLDTARMLSNRGLLLEVVPILRLCVEMMSWAVVVFHMEEESKIIETKAQYCITEMKNIYGTAGKIYGYLSKFSHWGHIIHGKFLVFDAERLALLEASVRYRAMSLALCLVILDIFVEVIRKLYGESSEGLIVKLQGDIAKNTIRNSRQMLSKIVEVADLDEIREIQSLLA